VVNPPLTTSGVNFKLNVGITDMIVSAVDSYGITMNSSVMVINLWSVICRNVRKISVLQNNLFNKVISGS
jgi:hypothetical protein